MCTPRDIHVHRHTHRDIYTTHIHTQRHTETDTYIHTHTQTHTHRDKYIYKQTHTWRRCGLAALRANRALASLGWVRKPGAPRLPLLSQRPPPGLPSPSSCAEGPRRPSTALPPSNNVRPPPTPPSPVLGLSFLFLLFGFILGLCNRRIPMSSWLSFAFPL